MKHLYAPWRQNYHKKKSSGCVFCLMNKDNNDSVHFVVKRFEYCYVALNLFPYNLGHVLVIPYRHKAYLGLLSSPARHELIDVVALSVSVLQTSLGAEGVNVGMNLGGQVAGGSIPQHLHIHVIPRWLGDTGFLTVTAETQQISCNLHETYEKIRQGFATA